MGYGVALAAEERGREGNDGVHIILNQFPMATVDSERDDLLERSRKDLRGI